MCKQFSFIGCACVLVFAGTACGAGRIVITEIMYDPDSNERQGETEWVEIANLGDEPVEIRNWRLDDEDASDWGPFSCDLAPGEVAVLVNKAFVTEDAFRAAWDIEAAPHSPPSAADDDAKGEPSSEPVKPAAYQVIPVEWSSLANSPTVENEILTLLDADGKTICKVNIQESGDWPNNSGASIWLSDLAAADLNLGKLWKSSLTDKDGARTSRVTEIFNRPDIGSPGFVFGLTAAGTPIAPGSAQTQPETPSANDDDDDDDVIDY